MQPEATPLPGDPAFRPFLRLAAENGHVTSRESFERGLVHDIIALAARKQAQASGPGDAPSGPGATDPADQLVLPEPLDLSTLLSGPPPKTAWLWDGWLAEAELALVVADPKVGKSLLVLSLAWAMACGDDCLGARCKRGRAGIIDLENPLGEVHKRTRALGLTAEENEGLVYWHMPDLDLADPKAAELVRGLIVRHDLTLLGIDSARRAAPGLDENDSGSVSRVFSPLRRVSAATGCAIVVVHHARKRVGDAPTDAGQMVRGSGDLVASVDTLLYLRAKEAGAFTLEAVARRGMPHEPILVRIENDEDDGSLRLINEGAVAAGEDKVESLLAKIMRALRSDGGTLERPVIAMRVGEDVRSGTFNRALKLGWQRGQLTKSDRVVGKPTSYSLAEGVYT